MSKNYVAHKFRLKPTKEQALVLKSWSDINRYVWNHFLAANQTKYQEEKKFIFYHEMANLLPALKKQHEFLGKIRGADVSLFDQEAYGSLARR